MGFTSLQPASQQSPLSTRFVSLVNVFEHFANGRHGAIEQAGSTQLLPGGTAPEQEVSREGERVLNSQTISGSSKSLHCNRAI